MFSPFYTLTGLIYARQSSARTGKSRNVAYKISQIKKVAEFCGINFRVKRNKFAKVVKIYLAKVNPIKVLCVTRKKKFLVLSFLCDCDFPPLSRPLNAQNKAFETANQIP